MKRVLDEPVQSFENSSLYDVKTLEPDSPKPQTKAAKHTEFSPTGAILPEGVPVLVDNPVGYQEVNNIETQKNFNLSFKVKKEGGKTKKKKLPYEGCFQAISDLANNKNVYSFTLLKEKYLLTYIDVFYTSPREAKTKDLWSSSDDWLYAHASIDLTGFQFLCCQNPINDEAMELSGKLCELILDKIPFETLLQSSAKYPEKFKPIFINKLFAKAVKNNDRELCGKLIRLIADVNSADHLEGYTPLSTAVRNKKLALVKLLIENQAELDKVDEFRKTALIYAAYNLVESKDQLNSESIEIFKFLLNEAASPKFIFIDNILGETSLLGYFVNNDCQMGIEILLSHLKRHKMSVDPLDSNHSTPLHTAVTRRNILAVHYLIDSGANLDALTKDGLSPFHIASIGLAEQSDQNVTMDTQIFELLLKHITDPNCKFSQNYRMAESGWTILHLLVVKNVVKMIELLLKCLVSKGLSVDTEDKRGFTPLFYAVQFQNYVVARLIMSAGGNLKHSNISLSVGIGSIIRKPKISDEELKRAVLYDQLLGEQVVLALNKSILLEEKCKLQELEIQSLKAELIELKSQVNNTTKSPKRNTHSNSEILSRIRERERRHSDSDISLKRERRHSDSDITPNGDPTVRKKLNYDTP